MAQSERWTELIIVVIALAILALIFLVTEADAAGPIRVARVTRALSLDPGAAVWEQASEETLTLLPQNMAMPVLDQATVPEVKVRALSDGREIAWRLSWVDVTADWNVDAGRFSDAAALQFPVDPNAPFMMGVPGMRVQIIYWKALWQKDIDEHFQDVQDLHPNYWADFYWFADPRTMESGRPRFRVPSSFTDPRSHAWFPAFQAGNPMADFYRTSPVEELVSAGFGSLTTHERSATGGRGVWHEGSWNVVFRRPLTTKDPLDAQLPAEGSGKVGFAIWDGSAGNVGGRKHWTPWISFEVMP